ncbi:hypothetical protein CsSME_00038419 [Camellia sinensis var. sinensis]
MLRCVYMMLLGIPISVSAVTLMKKLPMSSLMQEIYGASCYFIEAESMNKKKCLISFMHDAICFYEGDSVIYIL